MSNEEDFDAPFQEVLQLWRRDLIGWFDAPAHAFGFGSFQVAAIRTGGHPAGGWLVTCASLCPTARWKNSLPSADFRSTTSPSGGGCSVTPQKFSADCERGSDRPTTVGGWMRPTSGSRANGCIYTGLSTPPVRRSTSFSRLNATQQRLSAFSAKT